MFKNHQPNIEEFARKDPDNFAQVVLFVSATIQQMFHTVPAIVEDVRERGLDSKHLWGSKKDTWIYTLENKEMLFEAVLHADRIINFVLSSKFIISLKVSKPSLRSEPISGGVKTKNGSFCPSKNPASSP